MIVFYVQVEWLKSIDATCLILCPLNVGLNKQ